jgi:hypothetical protein
MQIIRTAQYNKQRERRFRASIYVDIWVPESPNAEADRAHALAQAENFASQIPNSYVGGVALHTNTLSKPLDREL